MIALEVERGEREWLRRGGEKKWGAGEAAAAAASSAGRERTLVWCKCYYAGQADD